MRALTVAQPWASLIMAGVKTIETRPAPPNGTMRPDGVRGLPGRAIEPSERIAIHAAATRPVSVGDWIASNRHGEWCVQRDVTKPGDLFGAHETLWLPLGTVVGTVVVIGAVPIVDLYGDAYDCRLGMVTTRGGLTLHPHHHTHPGEYGTRYIADQLPLGDFTPGRWAWLLDDPTPFNEPVPVRGRQGVWEWEPTRG